MAPIKSILLASALCAAQLVAGHSVIINAVGDAGGQGTALGVVASTPRDGTRRNPFQQDATRFRGASKATVGETVGAGTNNVEDGTTKILAENGGTLPQVTPGGEVTMTLHQVNGDGAGPYTCMINSDGTGTKWANIQVTQNVDGRNGNNRQGAKTDHPLAAAIPADQKCTGSVAGEDNVCLVRCQNTARAGPFGGVVPVQLSNGNAGNGTADAGADKANKNANAGAAKGGAAKGAKGAAADKGAKAAGNKNNNNNNNNNKRDLTVEKLQPFEEEEEEIEAGEESEVERRRAIEFSA
ncbi:Putative CAS1-like protein [[Torrubiella] hemipterigena]|uniref:Putative CAS1-like protein n=1 Tax=[Torrubiella] hemipterigena TaxID=1531966 RepID=A0A0A1SX32_9HYPO|nr:Putative CAS1-like protein [[Torrubiella] hemipterigena]